MPLFCCSSQKLRFNFFLISYSTQPIHQQVPLALSFKSLLNLCMSISISIPPPGSNFHDLISGLLSQLFHRFFHICYFLQWWGFYLLSVNSKGALLCLVLWELFLKLLSLATSVLSFYSTNTCVTKPLYKIPPV